MNLPLPSTAAIQLSAQVGALVMPLAKYISSESLDHRGRLRHEIDKLGHADAAASWALRAMYFTAFGKGAEAHEAAQNAVRLGVGLETQGSLAINTYMNFADFGRALELLTKAADPSGGYFSTQIAWLIRAGGIRTADSYCEIAKCGRRAESVVIQAE